MKILDADVAKRSTEPGGGVEASAAREGAGEAEEGTAAARILMVAGGTGGHIFPVLAVAEELRARSGRGASDRNYDIIFLGTNRALESRIIPAAGFRLRTVAAAGLKGIGGWRKAQNLLVLPRSAVETALLLGELQPDVVVGGGGYLSGPVMLEAALKDIPTLLIEANAVPGFTNRVLGPVVRAAAVAFEETAKYYGTKAHVTGQPVRKAFAVVPAKQHAPPFTILIIGGSQGSAAINQGVIRSLPLLKRFVGEWRFIHQTGERDYNAVRQAFEAQGLEAEVHAFIENVPEVLARADLVVSRAGATALAELTVAGKASLLVPFPGATDRHQLENARILERAGAARVLEQETLTPERLVEAMSSLLEWPALLVEMERAAKRLARPDAAERIADLVEKLAGT